MRAPGFWHRLLACSFLSVTSAACSLRANDQCGGCPGDQTCLELALPDGGLTVECGAVSDALGPCGPAIPAACASSDLACVTSDGLNGFCYQICDPGNPVCAADLSCLAILSTYDAGICAKPGPSGTTCDESQQMFCPIGQVCAGVCLKRCDPTLATDCPQLESCVTPYPFDPSLGVCVQPQTVGSKCSFETGTFCEKDAFCVSILSSDAGALCLKDCTDGGVCPPTQVCQSISNASMTYVRGACL